MARKRKTLASKIGVSSARLSSKIHKIKHETPGISNRAAAGKAAGILRPKKFARIRGKKR